MIIFLIIVFLLIFLFAACVTERKYHTYELHTYEFEDESENVPSNYHASLVRSQYVPDSQSFYLHTIANNRIISKEFRFRLSPRTKIDIGKKFFEEEYERVYLHTEPYDLSMRMSLYKTQKIIINKMLFKTEKGVIDFCHNASVSFNGMRHRDRFKNESNGDYFYKTFSEEELTEFRNSGIIDLSKFRDEWSDIGGILFSHKNIGVMFEKDDYFALEYDITLENSIEDFETENYSFTVKFNRQKFTDSYSLLVRGFIAALFR